MGIDSTGQITKIYRTQIDIHLWQDKRKGDYVVHPITGKFIHESKAVLHLHFEGLDTPIGATVHHPFWSVAQKAWVTASDLAIGEFVKTPTGTLMLTAKETLAEQHTVYNLEVYRVHNYLVSEVGVLVHNSSDLPTFKPTTSKEINQEIKRVVRGDGTPRRYDKGPKVGQQKTFEAWHSHKRGYESQKRWKDALEWDVKSTKSGQHLRILEKTLPDGSKIYGWSTDSDYKKIYKFIPKTE